MWPLCCFCWRSSGEIAGEIVMLSFEKIRDAATPGQDPVPAGLPSHSHLNRLGQASRHDLAEQGLACRILGLDESALLSGNLEHPDGKVLAVEVKLSAEVKDKDVKHLLWLGWVVNTGPRAYWRRDGILVVPGVLLGA